METVEVLVRIPEEYYKAIMKIPVNQSTADMLIIKNGTPIPKEYGGMSKDAEHIIKLIAKYFEPPCMYEYGDVDAFDFINKIDETEGINWCEEHCGSVSPCECWKRFFELMAKAEKEQMEEQDVN